MLGSYGSCKLVKHWKDYWYQNKIKAACNYSPIKKSIYSYLRFLDLTEGSGEAVPRGRQIQVARLAGNHTEHIIILTY